MDKNTRSPENKVNSEEVEEFDVSFPEKLTGIFVEPVKTFKTVRQFGPKLSDWLIPVLFFLVTLLLADLMVMTIPSIRYSMIEKQIVTQRAQLEKLVDKGLITRDRVTTQIDRLKKSYEKGLTPVQLQKSLFIVITEAGRFFVTVVFFFFLLKYLYRGKIQFRDVITAFGLPYYIKAFGSMVFIMAGLATSTYISDLSAASLFNVNKRELTGFLLSKIDLFNIWYYFVAAAGVSVLLKLNEKYKIIIIVFSAWITIGLFFFWIAGLFGLTNF